MVGSCLHCPRGALRSLLGLWCGQRVTSLLGSSAVVRGAVGKQRTLRQSGDIGLSRHTGDGIEEGGQRVLLHEPSFARLMRDHVQCPKRVRSRHRYIYIYKINLNFAGEFRDMSVCEVYVPDHGVLVLEYGLAEVQQHHFSLVGKVCEQQHCR